ncbi:hypothetical protein Tco_0792704 [Tanacetum coccineum]
MLNLGQVRQLKLLLAGNGLGHIASLDVKAFIVPSWWTGQCIDEDVDEQPVLDLALFVSKTSCTDASGSQRSEYSETSDPQLKSVSMKKSRRTPWDN